MKQRLQLLRQGIERRTRWDDSPWGTQGAGSRQDLTGPFNDPSLIEACLDELFSSMDSRVFVFSLNELLNLAKLGLDRSRIALKSLPQLGFLSGGAAGIFILAVGSLERAAWTLAGALGIFSIVSSLVSFFLARRAHRRARAFAGLVQKLGQERKDPSDG